MREEMASPARIAAGQAAERASVSEMRKELRKLRAEHKVLKAPAIVQPQGQEFHTGMFVVSSGEGVLPRFTGELATFLPRKCHTTSAFMQQDYVS